MARKSQKDFTHRPGRIPYWGRTCQAVAKNNDTPAIDGHLYRNKYGSCVRKFHKKLKANQEKCEEHDISQRKQGPYGTPEPLAERLSWDKQHRPTYSTNIPISETYTEFCKQTLSEKYKIQSYIQGSKGQNWRPCCH